MEKQGTIHPQQNSEMVDCRMSSRNILLLQKVSGEADADAALSVLLQRYAELELSIYEMEDKRYQEKWKMDFIEFSEKHHGDNRIEIIEEIFDWEVYYTGIEFYKSMLDDRN